MMAPNVWHEVIRPTLSDRMGYAIFCGTPSGRNHFYELYEYARQNPDWYAIKLPASVTGIIPPHELSEARATMGEEQYQREFEVSFDAAIIGAIFAVQLREAMTQKRMQDTIEINTQFPVYTSWDLGFRDQTGIWFYQIVGREIRALDYYEASGQPLAHYVTVLQQKQEQYGWKYGKHYLPHDVAVKELGCVDCDTEYLTPYGWKTISEYDGGLVAQWNKESGSAEFVHPIQFINLPCTEMWHFKTKYGINQMLSDEHRMLFFNDHNNWIELSAKDVSDKILQSNTRFQHKRIPTTYSAAFGTGLELTDEQIRVQVAIIADGHICKDWDGHIRVSIKKQRKKDRLRLLLDNANIAYTEKTNKRSSPGYSHFYFIPPVLEKCFGIHWWKCNNNQLSVVANEVVHWDGHIKKRKGRRDRWYFFSTNKSSADFIQHAWIVTFGTCTMTVDKREGRRDCFQLFRSMSSGKHLSGMKKDGSTNKNVTRVPTKDGRKYCFSVPSSYLILRREGCVFITGNSGKSRQEILHSLGLAPITILPALSIEDTIATAQSIFPRVHFHANNCRRGLDALASFRRDYDEKNRILRATPVHDWTDAAASSFRYMAISIPKDAPHPSTSTNRPVYYSDGLGKW